MHCIIVTSVPLQLDDIVGYCGVLSALWWMFKEHTTKYSAEFSKIAVRTRKLSGDCLDSPFIQIPNAHQISANKIKLEQLTLFNMGEKLLTTLTSDNDIAQPRFFCTKMLMMMILLCAAPVPAQGGLNHFGQNLVPRCSIHLPTVTVVVMMMMTGFIFQIGTNFQNQPI